MFQKLFSINGRIRRLEFGLSYVIVFIVSIFFILPFGGFFITNQILFFLFGVVVNWFLITQGVKRCHDLGNSGWYMFIPFYGLMMLFSDGELGANKYGPNPKGLDKPAFLNKTHQTYSNQSISLENSNDKKSNHALFFWLGIVFITIIFLLVRSVSYQASKFTQMIEESNKARNEYRRSMVDANKNDEAEVIKGEAILSDNNFEIIEQSSTVSSNYQQAHDCPITYSIQILASAKKLPRNAPEFRNLKFEIEERYLPNEKIYKYKYVVGKECSLTQIKRLKRKLRKLGFKGAFIVKMRS